MIKISIQREMLIYFVAIFTSLAWAINPQGWIADDSYFYLVIARNFSQIGAQTFSGIIPTNGVHPLWMWFLSGWDCILNIISPGLLSFPQFSLIASSLSLLLAIRFLLKISTLLNVDDEFILIPVFFTSFFGLLGSEAHLSLLTLAYFFYRTLLCYRLPTMRNFLLTGLAASLAILARLDNIFSVFAVLFALLALLRGRVRYLPVSPFLICGFIICIYCLFNDFLFGGIMPVSGWMKSSFPAITLHGYAGGNNPSLAGISIFFGWVPMMLTLLSLVFSKGSMRFLLLALFVGVIAKNLYIGLFTRSHTTWAWYSTLDIFVFSLSFSYSLSQTRYSVYIRKCLYACIFIFCMLMGYRAITYHSPLITIQSLALVKANTVPGNTILVSDWPGYVAFFAPDRHIFAADLLTANRYWYSEMIRHENALSFIADTCMRVGHPLTHILWNGNSWLVVSRDEGSIIYNDPRTYPAEREIGHLLFLSQPLSRHGDIRIWQLGR